MFRKFIQNGKKEESFMYLYKNAAIWQRFLFSLCQIISCSFEERLCKVAPHITIKKKTKKTNKDLQYHQTIAFAQVCDTSKLVTLFLSLENQASFEL